MLTTGAKGADVLRDRRQRGQLLVAMAQQKKGPLIRRFIGGFYRMMQVAQISQTIFGSDRGDS